MLRTGEWGWIQPKEGAPSWAGLSPTTRLMLAGLFMIWIFFRWEARVEAKGREPLLRPAMLQNRQLSGGLTMVFFQFLVQGGFFFVVPLFLSVCLGLSALQTGVRLLPLSITLMAAATGIPKLLPDVSPRLVVRSGLLALLQAPSSCSSASILRPERRSSSSRCCWWGSESARSPRNSARHRFGGTRRAEPRGRGRPEHGDEPRRLAGHCSPTSRRARRYRTGSRTWRRSSSWAECPSSPTLTSRTPWTRPV